MNDREKLAAAFNKLQSLGYFAPVEYGTTQCCQSCAWYEVPDGTTKAVFWHQQGDERAFGVYMPCSEDDEELSYEDRVGTSNTLIEKLHLYWDGDAQEICDALREQGLTVVQPESEASAIVVEA